MQFISVLTFVCLCTSSLLATVTTSSKLSLDDIYNMDLQELLTVKVETAGKTLQNIEDVPSTMYVITAQDIEENGFTTLAEALSMVPGIHMDRNWYLDRLVVRGEPDTDTKLLLMVDGQSMTMRGDNFNIFNGAAPIEIRDIKRIEVLLGPQSVLYGSGAFTGLVNVISKNAEESAYVNLNASSVGERGVYASYGDQIKQMHLSLSSGVQYSEGDSFDFIFPDGRPPDYVQTTGTADGFNTVDSFRFAAKLENNDLAIRAQYSDARIVWPDSLFDVDFNNAGSYYNVEHRSIQAKHHHALSSDLSGTARLYYIDSEGIWRGIYNGVPYPTPQGNELWHYGGKAYGGEYRVEYTPFSSLSLVSGLEFTDTFDSYSADDQRSYTSTSLFAMLSYRPFEQLHFEAGARVEKYSFRNKEELLPQIAGIYKPTPHASLKLSYARGFLAPSTWELQIADLVGNDNLEPEFVDNYEFIYSHDYQNWLHSFSFYYAEHTKLKIISDTGFQASSVARNSAYKRLFKGLDYNAVFFPLQKTSVKLGLSYVDTTDKDESTGLEKGVEGAYNFLSYLNLRQILPDSSILSLNGKYVSEPNGYEQIDSWTRFDLIWLKKDLFGFTLRLKAGNLLNEKITTYARGGVVTEVPDHQRFYTVDISKQF